MGCKFCASTKAGFCRNLSAGEILLQMVEITRDMRKDEKDFRIGHVVLMGIGEPLDNYDNVLTFLRLVGHEKGINIGYRHISLSTCGVVDKIYALAEEALPITLSISLHAADDETRSSIMPVNRKWNVVTLLRACRDYYAKTGRRLSFEYTLIADKNDSPKDAERLATVLNANLRSAKSSMPIHVNLIPVNKVEGKPFTKSDVATQKNFVSILDKHGIRATIRRRLGSDINAACGQLRRNATQIKSDSQEVTQS